MEELITGKNLDAIIEYSLKRYELDENDFIFSHELEDEILTEYNQSEIKIMLDFIANYEFKVLETDLNYNPNFKANELTKRFLKNGGFTKIFAENQSQIVKENEKKNVQERITKLNLINLEHEDKIRNQKDRIRDLDEELKVMNLLQKYWWVIGVSIGIGIAVREFLF